jgi:hypothetical protein
VLSQDSIRDRGHACLSPSPTPVVVIKTLDKLVAQSVGLVRLGHNAVDGTSPRIEQIPNPPISVQVVLSQMVSCGHRETYYCLSCVVNSALLLNPLSGPSASAELTRVDPVPY